MDDLIAATAHQAKTFGFSDAIRLTSVVDVLGSRYPEAFSAKRAAIRAKGVA